MTRMDPDADMKERGGFGAAMVAEPQPLRPQGPKKPRTVLVVMVAFKWDLEMSGREAKAIARGLYGYPLAAAMHSKRQIAYIVQTDLTADQMMSRLAEPLAAGAVECAWAFTPGADIACNTPMEPMAEKVAAAWREVRRFNYRLPKQRLPASLTQFETVDDDGGRRTTRILDQHPLQGKRPAW